jgi:hypothetical protein
MKNLIRRRPATGTREREEARAFVQFALSILPRLASRRRRGTR